MKGSVALLHEAQKTLLSVPLGAPPWEALGRTLSATVPAPVLSHFLRLVSTGRPGVSLVRRGVCSQCHIRVGLGIAAALRNPENLHLCDHCGCYLLMPDDELPPTHAVTAPATTARKRPRAMTV